MARLGKEWQCPYHFSDILAIRLICRLYYSTNLSEQDRSIKFTGKLLTTLHLASTNLFEPYLSSCQHRYRTGTTISSGDGSPVQIDSLSLTVFLTWPHSCVVSWSARKRKQYSGKLQKFESQNTERIAAAIVNFLYLTRANQWWLPLC